MIKLDSYSILIVSKYLETKQDFINLISVRKSFRLTTEKLRFNPISISSLTLFPLIQTLYLYDQEDKIIESNQLNKIYLITQNDEKYQGQNHLSEQEKIQLLNEKIKEKIKQSEENSPFLEN